MLLQNWFQNRRAREKKEKNIREYEAKQKREKEQAEANGTSLSDNRKRDLVASSAPFPEPRKVIQDSSASSPNSTSDDVSDAVETAKSESVETTPDLLCDTTFRKTSRHDDDQSEHSPSEVADYLSMSDASGDMPYSDSEGYASLQNRTPDQLFAEYQTMMVQNGGLKSGEFFSSPMFLNGHAHLDMVSPTSDSQLKSPPSIDIASRRNRRPTPLSINNARACASNGPRTAIDISKMADKASFMRRTSSGSGSCRVTKNVATPRNMYTLNRTPSSSGQSSSTAPPTPDTPLVAGNALTGEIAMPTALSLDAKFMVNSFVNQDPTLTTPPTTPGIVDGLFQMGSAYGMPISEDCIVGMGMGHLPNSFQMVTGAPSYVAGSSNSRNTSPTEPVMYGSQMGSAYYGMYGNNA